MKRRQMIVLTILLLIGNYACNTKEHIQGKWHQSSRFFLEFRSNNSLYAEQQPGPANQSVLKDYGTYEIVNDSTLIMQFLPDDKPQNFIFIIKDSLLLLIHPYREVVEEKEVQLYDSAFYHRNPNYTVEHIKQLYKFGKIDGTSHK